MKDMTVEVISVERAEFSHTTRVNTPYFKNGKSSSEVTFTVANAEGKSALIVAQVDYVEWGTKSPDGEGPRITKFIEPSVDQVVSAPLFKVTYNDIPVTFKAGAISKNQIGLKAGDIQQEKMGKRYKQMLALGLTKTLSEQSNMKDMTVEVISVERAKFSHTTRVNTPYFKNGQSSSKVTFTVANAEGKSALIVAQVNYVEWGTKSPDGEGPRITKFFDPRVGGNLDNFLSYLSLPVP